MPRYKNSRRTWQYSNDFKVKAVELSYQECIQVQQVAVGLDIHPFMLSVDIKIVAAWITQFLVNGVRQQYPRKDLLARGSVSPPRRDRNSRFRESTGNYPDAEGAIPGATRPPLHIQACHR